MVFKWCQKSLTESKVESGEKLMNWKVLTYLLSNKYYYIILILINLILILI